MGGMSYQQVDLPQIIRFLQNDAEKWQRFLDIIGNSANKMVQGFLVRRLMFTQHKNCSFSFTDPDTSRMGEHPTQ